MLGIPCGNKEKCKRKMIDNDIMPAHNERFGASGGVTPQNV